MRLTPPSVEVAYLRIQDAPALATQTPMDMSVSVDESDEIDRLFTAGP